MNDSMTHLLKTSLISLLEKFVLGFKKYVQVLSCSSPQECSNDLTNYVRMPLLVSSSSVQTTTVVSLVSGSSEARTLHFL